MGESDLSEGNPDGNEQQNRSETRATSQLSENIGAHRPSIPMSAIVAIFTQSLITLYLIYCGISVLIDTGEDPRSMSGFWPFLLARLLVALGVLIGMRHRKHIALKVSRGFCTAGLICGAVFVIFTLTVGVTSLPRYEMLKIVSLQWIVWLILLASLNTKSATQWFTK